MLKPARADLRTCIVRLRRWRVEDVARWELVEEAVEFLEKRRDDDDYDADASKGNQTLLEPGSNQHFQLWLHMIYIFRPMVVTFLPCISSVICKWARPQWVLADFDP